MIGLSLMTNCFKNNIFLKLTMNIMGKQFIHTFLIRTDEEPQLSVFEPNSCDILADDWVIVDD